MARLTYANDTIFDFGALKELGPSMAALGITRPLICTDKGLIAAGIIDKVRGVLSNDIAATIFDGTPENPTEAAILEAAEMYREAGCDGVIAVGGGSSMDLSKGVALAVTHEGDLLGYTTGGGNAAKIGEVAPLIAIPTTSGTGSEVSGGSVVIMNTGDKLILGSRHLVPRVAICDPELTLGLPAGLTAATGMDAVTHCIEAIMSPMVNPPAEAVGLDGLQRSVRDGHLKRAVADGSDREARWNMMMAANEGALAFTKGLGNVHAMSHACGSLPGMTLHHGTLNAVILPAVLRYNIDHVGDKFSRIADSMGLPEAADLAEAVEAINVDLGLPAGLAAMGVSEDKIPYLVQHSSKDFCAMTNPRPTSPEEFEQLFHDAMGAA